MGGIYLMPPGHGNEPSRKDTEAEEKAQCRIRVFTECEQVARRDGRLKEV